MERKFGEAKERHGLRRCRYVGILKYLFQVVFTALALNVKRIVKLTTVAGFTAPAMAGT